MKKTPFLYSAGAAIYVALIVLLINFFSYLHIPDNTVLVPMTMLGLFVLSAAIMGFLFLSEPINLYVNGQKKEATIFFGKTVLFFACFVAIFLSLLLLQK